MGPDFNKMEPNKILTIAFLVLIFGLVCTVVITNSQAVIVGGSLILASALTFVCYLKRLREINKNKE